MQRSRDKYAALWSGGKDSCLALSKARQLGLEVPGIINFFDASSRRVRFHAIRNELILEQANALGVEVFQFETHTDSFATSFDAALEHIKACGYVGVIAGDIHLEDVRSWNEQKVNSAGMHLVEPLWHVPALTILEELVNTRFRAILTCCDERWSSTCWPGREIDRAFIGDVATLSGFDPCGEHGEYHSFVYDGPLFSRRIGWTSGELRRSNGFSQMDVIPTRPQNEIVGVRSGQNL